MSNLAGCLSTTKACTYLLKFEYMSKKISRCHTHIRGNCWKLWMLHPLFWCLGILGRIQCHSWSWFNRGTELIMILNVKCHTGKGLNMNLLGNAHLCRSVACGIYFVQSSATNKFSLLGAGGSTSNVFVGHCSVSNDFECKACYEVHDALCSSLNYVKKKNGSKDLWYDTLIYLIVLIPCFLSFSYRNYTRLFLLWNTNSTVIRGFET